MQGNGFARAHRILRRIRNVLLFIHFHLYSRFVEKMVVSTYKTTRIMWPQCVHHSARIRIHLYINILPTWFSRHMKMMMIIIIVGCRVARTMYEHEFALIRNAFN